LGTTVIPPTNEDFDFLNEMEFSPEDAEDFSEVKDTGLGLGSIDEEETVAEEEEDEFGSEFSDNDEDDEFGGGRKGSHDDY